MDLIDYLGRRLKDDAVIALLERYDTDVIYHFDRLRENTQDRYTAAIREAGVELGFDLAQTLTTVFCYVEPRDGFSAVDVASIGVALYGSITQAKAGAVQLAGTFSHRDGVEFQGRRRGWVSFELAGRIVHYEFSADRLSLVTLSLPKAANA